MASGDRIAALIARFPAVIVLVALLCTALALTRVVDFRSGRLGVGVDASLAGLLPAGGAALATYARTRELFGSDDVLLVAWLGDDLFEPATLRALKRLTRDIQRIDGVRRVDSLASALRVHNVGDMVEVDRFLARIPRDPQGLAALRADALANPLYGAYLVAPDGRGALLSVQFETDLDAAALAPAVTAIEAASRRHAGSREQFVAGPIHARLEIGRILFRDMRQALPLAVLVTALVAALALRSVRGVVLPLAATGMALVVTLAVFAGNGHALNFVTVIVPPVVFVVGFALAVHVINEFDSAFRSPQHKAAAVRDSVRELALPLTLTAFTTAVGFASLATSPIDSIRVFGLYTALGTLLGWLAALCVIPACLLLAPVRVRARGDGGWLRALAPRLARFDLRHRGAIIALCALLAVLAAAGASRIDVSTDYLANFHADNPVRRNFERVREHFAGAVPLQILIESEFDDTFGDPVHLRTLDTFERWLEAQPEIGTAVTLVDFIDVLHRAFEPGQDDAARVPSTTAAVEDALFLAAGDELDRFVDARHRRTLLHVSTSAVSTNALGGLIERIEARLAELPGHLHGQVTGSSALMARTLDDVVRGQLVSLAGALVVIYAVLIALFGSFRVGALALFPNILPIAAFFGILGASGTTLNLATSLVASVVLGIAVDDSMHFLSRFNAEARRVAHEEEGIERALVSVIRPVTFTTLALCGGFLTLTLGELRSQVEFGALAAATLALAWVLDLTFTPALAGRLRFVTLWEVLSVDLGAAPHRTIPVFAGLSLRQARIAAILGALERFEAGARILSLGDRGRDIHIVIDGELSVSLPRDGHDQVLRTLRRGDLIGEVALFHGQRTANVDAVSEARLLRLDDAALARIQARYPRIAARLYRNLGVILADRLADVTERL